MGKVICAHDQVNLLVRHSQAESEDVSLELRNKFGAKVLVTQQTDEKRETHRLLELTMEGVPNQNKGTSMLMKRKTKQKSSSQRTQNMAKEEDQPKVPQRSKKIVNLMFLLDWTITNRKQKKQSMSSQKFGRKGKREKVTCLVAPILLPIPMCEFVSHYQAILLH